MFRPGDPAVEFMIEIDGKVYPFEIGPNDGRSLIKFMIRCFDKIQRRRMPDHGGPNPETCPRCKRNHKAAMENA